MDNLGPQKAVLQPRLPILAATAEAHRVGVVIRATPRRRVKIERWIHAIPWIAMFCLGCDESSGTAPDTLCGQGTVAVALGVEAPFEARPDHIFPIDQGLQGGHHLDVSLRIKGSMDPMQTDIRLTLFDQRLILAEHRVDQWTLEPGTPERYCEYLRARLVLMDPDDRLLPAEKIPPLLNRFMVLSVILESPKGRFSGAFDLSFDRINSLE